MTDTDVAVVGYGPVGAFAALLLARAGLSCTVIDRREHVHALPRAVAADDEVLRLLAVSGLEDAVAAMVPVPGVTFLGRQGQVVSQLDFGSGLDLGGEPGGRPGLALFRQPDLEAQLRRQVAAQERVQVRLGTAVTGLWAWRRAAEETPSPPRAS